MDQCAQVPYDPNATKEAVGLRRGLCYMQVLGPTGSMGGTEDVSGLDLGRNAWSGPGSQIGKCDGGGAFYALVLGSYDPVVYSAYVCHDQLGRVTQLLGCAAGGGINELTF